MTYWVVKLDSNLPKRPGGVRTEVSIHYPSESREEAEKTADTLNEYEAREAERIIASNTGQHRAVSPGTTPVSYIVMSEDDLQRYYEAGIRVVRYP